MRKHFHVPSPSMIVALLALFVAMSGTAVAAGALAKNSVGSKQIKKNAVSGSKVKNDSLTGADIKESTLATVPSATTAGSAGAVAAGAITGAGIADGSLNLKDVAHASGLINLNFGSIAANSCSLQAPQPVPGVDLTKDLIIAQPDYGTFSTNLSVTAGNSNNTNGFFRLVVCNPTGSAIDPAASDFQWAAISLG